MSEYTYYCDSGHGWLAVKRVELERLGLLDKVSSYSYHKGRSVYLEEDCDLSMFLNAKRANGEYWTFNEVYHRGQSWIRSLQHYRNLVTA